MKNVILGALLGLGLSVAGSLLLGNADDGGGSTVAPDQHGMQRPADTVPSPAATTLQGSGGSADGILARLTSVEQELRRLSDAISALAGAPASERNGLSSPLPAVIEPGTEDAVRARWSEALDEWEGNLRALGPEDSGDAVLHSRWQDLRRARGALQGAHTGLDLQRLAEGEFKAVFRLP